MLLLKCASFLQERKVRLNFTFNNMHMKKSWDMKLFLTPVDTFLAPSGLYRKCTRDIAIYC